MGVIYFLWNIYDMEKHYSQWLLSVACLNGLFKTRRKVVRVEKVERIFYKILFLNFSSSKLLFLMDQVCFLFN